MAVLTFDGTDDWVRCSTIPSGWNGAFTVAAIINHDHRSLR